MVKVAVTSLVKLTVVADSSAIHRKGSVELSYFG